MLLMWPQTAGTFCCSYATGLSWLHHLHVIGSELLRAPPVTGIAPGVTTLSCVAAAPLSSLFNPLESERSRRFDCVINRVANVAADSWHLLLQLLNRVLWLHYLHVSGLALSWAPCS